MPSAFYFFCVVILFRTYPIHTHTDREWHSGVYLARERVAAAKGLDGYVPEDMTTQILAGKVIIHHC